MSVVKLKRKSRTLVLREQKIAIIFCSRITRCRMTKCYTQRTYEKEGFNTFCVSMSDYDEKKALSSVEELLKKIKNLGS
ncbi:MAG: hypothetical protein QN229_00320 [Desulfurococcaceae archaeon TW002]